MSAVSKRTISYGMAHEDGPSHLCCKIRVTPDDPYQSACVLLITLDQAEELVPAMRKDSGELFWDLKGRMFYICRNDIHIERNLPEPVGESWQYDPTNFERRNIVDCYNHDFDAILATLSNWLKVNNRTEGKKPPKPRDWTQTIRDVIHHLKHDSLRFEDNGLTNEEWELFRKLVAECGALEETE